MPSTYTANKIYELQSTGENVGTWGALLNAVLSILDLNLGGRLALNVAGAADVTLTTTQERNAYILMTGILTGSINLVFTATNGGFYLIDNRSTGSFTITAKPSGGTGVVIPQNAKCLVMVDPDNTRCVIVDLAQMMTTRGDILYRDANGAQRLAVGAANRLLASDGTDPLWRTLSAEIDAAIGSTRGQILYRGAATWDALSPGTSGKFLETLGAGADPAWATLPGGATAAFSANKNAVAQSFANNTVTKITFTTEVFDTGGFYDAPNSKWVPPAGAIIINAGITFDATFGNANTFALLIYKNGAEFKVAYNVVQASVSPASALHSITISIVDSANGTDYYEIFGYEISSVATPEVVGTITRTFFMGSLL